MCVLPGRGESLQSRQDVSPYLCVCFLSGAPVDSVNRLGGNLFLLLCRSRRNVTTTHQRVYTSQGEADLRGLRRTGQSRRLTYFQRTTGVVSFFFKESPTFFPFFKAFPDRHALPFPFPLRRSFARTFVPSATRKAERSPLEGGGPTNLRAGGLLHPGRTLKTKVSLVRTNSVSVLFH